MHSPPTSGLAENNQKQQESGGARAAALQSRLQQFPTSKLISSATQTVTATRAGLSHYILLFVLLFLGQLQRETAQLRFYFSVGMSMLFISYSVVATEDVGINRCD